MSNEPWNELNLAAAGRIRPSLAARVVAEALRRREALRENARGLVLAGAALACLVLVGIEVNARAVASARLAQWNEVADWVQSIER
jgi:hypothetical protein